MLDIHFDDRDEAIRQARVVIWQTRSGPRVGDYVEMADGTLRRFTHDWGDEIQVSCTWCGGSFYFGHGRCDYSGALDPAIAKADLTDTGTLRDGPVWFFHHDRAGAGRGVDCTIPCRVYRQRRCEEENREGPGDPGAGDARGSHTVPDPQSGEPS